MIRINLAPEEERKSAFFWIPEFTVLILAGGLTWLFSESYLQSIRLQIFELKTQTAGEERQYLNILPEIQSFDALSQEISDLQSKVAALKQLTISRIERFRPVVLIEHLQNLRPEGVWFDQVVDDTATKRLRLAGGALDPLLVAEFMTSLSSTSNQDVDSNDVRSMIYFEKVDLKRMSTRNFVGEGGGGAGSDGLNSFRAAEGIFPELVGSQGFELEINYRERGGGHSPLSLSQLYRKPDHG